MARQKTRVVVAGEAYGTLGQFVPHRVKVRVIAAHTSTHARWKLPVCGIRNAPFELLWRVADGRV